MDALARGDVPLLRTHGVMKASFPDKPPSGAPDQGAVHQQDDGRVGGEQGPDDQSEQRPTQAERRPLGAVKHAVIGREVPVVAQPHRPQRRRDGPLSRRQDRAEHQDACVSEGRTGESYGEDLQQIRDCGTGRRQHEPGMPDDCLRPPRMLAVFSGHAAYAA